MWHIFWHIPHLSSSNSRSKWLGWSSLVSTTSITHNTYSSAKGFKRFQLVLWHIVFPIGDLTNLLNPELVSCHNIAHISHMNNTGLIDGNSSLPTTSTLRSRFQGQSSQRLWRRFPFVRWQAGLVVIIVAKLANFWHILVVLAYFGVFWYVLAYVSPLTSWSVRSTWYSTIGAPGWGRATCWRSSSRSCSCTRTCSSGKAGCTCWTVGNRGCRSEELYRLRFLAKAARSQYSIFWCCCCA